MSKNFKVVGRSLPRLGGLAKASGSAVYIADLEIPGAWAAGVLRSPVAAGRLNGVKRSPEFDWSKVVVITAGELPGPNVVAMIRDDYEILAESRITYASQAVAIVAAPDEKLLREALAALEPDITPATPALSIDDALAGVSRVWGEDNVMDEFRIRRGDVEQGFAEADLILEHTYRTGYQEHVYLETQGMAAWPGADGGIEVAGSLQCPYYVHKSLVKALKLPAEKVRVRQCLTGGAFGGKEDYPSVLGVWVALLALACGKPVRMIYDRAEDMLSSTKRHPSRIIHKTGFKRDGTITACQADLLLDGGANTTMTKVVLSRAILHSTGAYKVPNADIRARAVATNTPPNGAFRGFGAPQSLYAMERQMDLAACRLGLNPYEIRMKNVMRKGDSFPFGQVLNEGVCAAEALEDVVKRSDYLRKYKEYTGQGGRRRKGIGLSLAMHGGGFTGSGEDNMGTTAEVEYLPGGNVEVLSSITDMGQGADTVLPMIAAEALGLPLERVSHPVPDTDRVPNSGPTVASRSTMFVGRVVYDACKDMLDKLGKRLAEKLGIPEVVFEGGAFRQNGKAVASLDEAASAWLRECGPLRGRAVFQPAPGLAWDDEKCQGTAYKGYSWLAQAVEIEVDMDTYEIHAKHCTMTTEAGRAVNPVQLTGQMEGGVLQSYGGAFLEDLGLTAEGKYNVSHLSAYLIPTTLDAPEFDLRVFEEPCAIGPYGAKGIGELSMDGGAPALAAAVQNACGVFADENPVMGEYLFNLLESAPQCGRNSENGRKL